MLPYAVLFSSSSIRLSNWSIFFNNKPTESRSNLQALISCCIDSKRCSILSKRISTLSNFLSMRSSILPISSIMAFTIIFISSFMRHLPLVQPVLYAYYIRFQGVFKQNISAALYRAAAVLFPKLTLLFPQQRIYFIITLYVYMILSV